MDHLRDEMMESLFETAQAPMNADWKSLHQALSRSGLYSTEAESGVALGGSPELEQALLSLAGGTSNLFVNSAHSGAAPRTVAELTPASIVDSPSLGSTSAPGTAFSFDFLPESPASVPRSPLSTHADSYPAERLQSTASSSPQSAARAGPAAPTAPLDPQVQEDLKKQRKKERNRIAAMKCRRKKVEREMELENKVKTLRQQNTDLLSEVVRLRTQVVTLKQTVMRHVTSGCPVFAVNSNQTL